MKVVRVLVWLVALVPALLAGLWVSFASPWPEPAADRVALREVTSRWRWDQWDDFTREPMHAVPRALHLGVLEIPGATIASVAWMNALFAVVLAIALAGLLRRAFALNWFGGAVALALSGMLVAAPSYGANWLHGERLGVFLPPLFLVIALSWLQQERFFGLGALGALLLAALAPFCHSHGVLVFVALLPAVLAGAVRAGSNRSIPLAGLFLIVGNIAAVMSLRDTGGIAAAGAAWPERVAASFAPTMVELWERTGSTWPDVMPWMRGDELALGALSWTIPVVLWRIGDRSQAARGVAAPWWSCFWFGLAIVVWDTLRYDQAPPSGTWHEAMYGAFLLPVGAVGVIAARFGREALAFGAGAFAVLGAQGWYHGLEELRIARAHVEQRDARMALPSTFFPADAKALPVEEALAPLRERGWVPAPGDNGELALTDAVGAPPAPELGACSAGDTKHLEGTLRSSLRGDGVQWVFAVAAAGPGAGGSSPPRVLGRVAPDFRRAGRDVPWSCDLEQAPAEGDTVRAVGYVPRSGRFVALGAPFVVRNGALEPRAETGS